MLGKKKSSWESERQQLKKEYQTKGITSCELRLPGCWRDNALSFAHRHKRAWYLSHPELLGKFNQTLLACIPCHTQIEFNKKLTEELFEIKRGLEKL